MDSLSRNINKVKCSVLGVGFVPTTLSAAVLYIKENARKLGGRYICFSNVHTTVIAADVPVYRRILNGAAFVFPDGAPIAAYIRKHGFEGAERVAGPDFMEKMFELTADGSLSHFFFGSTEETLAGLKANLEEKYPGLDVRGYFSPPFGDVSEEEDEQIMKMLNESGADIIWVGLGAPKQEKWMVKHKKRVKGLMMGVGAGFDFHGGTIKRAPVIMQKTGLEWLYRLLSDPQRLFFRYLTTNIRFIIYTLTGKKTDDF